MLCLGCYRTAMHTGEPEDVRGEIVLSCIGGGAYAEEVPGLPAEQSEEQLHRLCMVSGW